MNVSQHVRRLSGETMVYGIPQATSRLIATFLIPLYTRVFTPSEYGLLGLITSITQLMSTFVVLGLDSATARWFYDSREAYHQRSVISCWFWSQFAVSVCSSTLLAIGSPVFSRALPGSILDPQILSIAVWMVPLLTFGRVLGSLFRYRRRPWQNVWYSLLSSLVVVGMIIVFVRVMHRGLEGLFVAQILANGFMGLVALFSLRRWIRPDAFSWRLLQRMLAYGLPLIPASVAGWITASSDRFLITLLAGAEESGVYFVAVQIATAITLVTAAFQQAWGPFAFSILKEKDSHQVYARVFSVYWLLGSLAALTLSLFSGLILHVFTTPGFYSAATCIPFLLFGNLALSSTYIGVLGAEIEKHSAPIAVSIFIGAALDFGLNLLLIPRLGKEGAALSMMIAYTVSAVFIFYQSHRIHPIPYHFSHALICVGVSGVLIAIDRAFFNAVSLGGALAKVGMLVAFAGLAFPLKLVGGGALRGPRSGPSESQPELPKRV